MKFGSVSLGFAEKSSTGGDQEPRDSRRVRRGCGLAVELSEREDEAADKNRGDAVKRKPSTRIRKGEG